LGWDGLIESSHVRRVDGQLDRLQLPKTQSQPTSPTTSSTSEDLQEAHELSIEPPDLSRILQLQTAIQAFSTASSSRVSLHSARIHAILEEAEFTISTQSSDGTGRGPQSSQEQELEWVLISKATVQTYGLILNALLEQTIPLSSDIWYWDEVLGSYTNTALYSLQTSPLRMWWWASDVYHDARQRLQSLQTASEGEALKARSISDRWRKFYGLVKDSVRDRSLADMRSKIMSPLTLCHMEARTKQRRLKKLREMSASGLGVLMDEGLTFDVDDEGVMISKGRNEVDREEWKSVVSKSIALMEIVLRNVTVLELGAGDFEDTVFMSVEDDPGHHSAEGQQSSPSVWLAERLQQILQVHMPSHVATSRKLAAEYGRPSRTIRYWPLATVFFLSSSTILRIVVKRKAAIVTWIRDLGTTTVDFWYNWVVEPVKKIVGTIRHDEDSEIALMSKASLEGDRSSLERMVVDFAKDNASSSSGRPLNDSEIADIRAKVREGDLTPVLKAYEKDLQRPFVGTVRGNLVRALLIQIQKTKVDVEVAIGGIDSLLKSQELVFG
jgi:nuclear-control-of-ATPase protein 2